MILSKLAGFIAQSKEAVHPRSFCPIRWGQVGTRSIIAKTVSSPISRTRAIVAFLRGSLIRWMVGRVLAVAISFQAVWMDCSSSERLAVTGVASDLLSLECVALS